MKKCPYCAEEIQDEAIVCKWCGKELTTGTEKDGFKNQFSKKIIWIFIISFVAIGILISIYALNKPLVHKFTPSTPQEIELQKEVVGDEPIEENVSPRNAEYLDLIQFYSPQLLYDLADSIEEKGSDTFINVTLNKNEYLHNLVGLGWDWCAKNSEILDENWSKIKINYRINGTDVLEDSTYEYYFDGKTQNDKLEVVDSKCKRDVVVLTDWSIGENQLSIEVNFLEEINDGWEIFEENTKHYEFYDVTVREAKQIGELIESSPKDIIETITKVSGRIYISAYHNGPDFDLYMIDLNNNSIVEIGRGVSVDVAFGISPNGNKIIYCSQNENSTEEFVFKDIVVFNVEDKSITNLTNYKTDDCGYSWSPSGNMIAFDSNRTGDYEIFTMSIDGDVINQITNDNENNFIPIYSPDGKELIYITIFNNSDSDINSITVDGDNYSRLTNGMQIYAYAWSPKGTLIALVDSKSKDLFTLNTKDGEVKNITVDTGFDYIEFSSWTPEGNLIFNTSEGVYEIGSDDSNLKRILEIPLESPYSFSISPGGEYFVFETKEESRSILVIANRDGSNLIPLPIDPHFSFGDIFNVFWSK